MLVDHAEPGIERWRRMADGFVPIEHRSAEPLTLASISATLQLADLDLGAS